MLAFSDGAKKRQQRRFLLPVARGAEIHFRRANASGPPLYSS